MRLFQFYCILFLFSIVGYSQSNPMNVNVKPDQMMEWTRLPSDGEIAEAVRNLQDELTQDISVNGVQVDSKRVELSQVIKSHNKLLAGKREPWTISSARIFAGTISQYRTTIWGYSLRQNQQTGKFGFVYGYMGKYRPQSISEAYNDRYNSIKNSDNEAFGFAPPMGSSAENSTIAGTDIDGIVPIDENEDDIPWELVIGGSIAAVVAAILRKILKKGVSAAANSKSTSKKEKNQKEKKEENEEEANYILQLNKNNFQLKLNEPETLEARVWKVTSKGEKQCNADIQIQNPEKALKITPTTGVNNLEAQLLLQQQPKEPNFNIIVTANAEGHEFQRAVNIRPFGEMQIVVETAPDNKRSLRPDTFQTIACYAQVVDENGKNIPDLTKKIKFDPKSDWVDVSETVLDGDKMGVNIGCTNPNPNAAVSNPPNTVTLSIFMDEVAEGEEPLQNDLVITLLDCKLEVEITECSFPVTEEISEITFDAYIENTDGDEDWNFSGEYRKGIDPDEPLTEISISRKSETEVTITLTGPILKPSGNETFLNKTLIISAAQGEEKPLERRISVSVSQVGLFIKKGVEGTNELMFTADKPFESNLDFALYKYDKNSNQIVVDENGLEYLTFELQNEEQELINLASVLNPTLSFDKLVTNIPYGRWNFKTQEDIPGFGEIHTLNYLVKAPFGIDDNPEVFEQILKVRVRTYGIGKEFPEWVEAYEQCKHIINNYVPVGEPRNKLNDILEARKLVLGAEGLTELRNRIWKIAQDLILAEGAEGYKSMEVWANRITVTLEWTEWAGDLAFNALAAYYLKGVGAVGASMVKGGMIEALNFYIYDNDKGWDVFVDRQYEKIIPFLMNVAKGRLISIENIELVVKKNKILAWTIFISCEFLYNLYQTKSVVEAAKITAAQLRDELIMRKLTAKLQNDALKYNLKFTSPDEVLDALVKSVKTVNGEDIIDPKKLLEFMRDPAAVRTIKNHGTEWMKQVFEKSRNKIYKQHDAELKKYISETYKIEPNDIKIDDFRTPGTDGKTNLNTDRDYRVLRKVKTKNGDVWIEVQSPNWKQKSYEIFGETTGKPEGVSSQEWAESHQQRGTDRFDSEASKDYADNTYNPDTGEINRNKPNILQVKEGKGRLIDSEELGNMYKNKVNHALEPGMEPEAYAQAKKGVDTLKKVRDGYGVQGLDVPEIPDKLKKAMDIVEKAHVDANATPEHIEMLNKKLKDLDYKNIGDVAKDMADSFKDLKKHDSNDPRQVIFGW
ncbi:hypothetical protein [Lutibacter sp.]|uniref:hypothetical protein n=1 Tax=Lutibacter sp. TaxID=1925666 RepID=UPI002735584B|nr:hypothetical protein [Lutibacter sp.]MDP3313721.1 hypothetical protein [Lutibacter sp.]